MTVIQVLGTGCKKCASLKESAESAVRQLGIEADIQKVEDINEIIQFGVISTPALVVDGEVKFVGRVASPQEIIDVLSDGSPRGRQQHEEPSR